MAPAFTFPSMRVAVPAGFVVTSLLDRPRFYVLGRSWSGYNAVTVEAGGSYLRLQIALSLN